MIPRSRILIACSAFAATLSLTVLLESAAFSAWTMASLPADPADNAAIHSLGSLMVSGVPALFLVALISSLAITFRLWRAEPPRLSEVAWLIGLSALVAGTVLAVPGSGFAPVLSPEFAAAVAVGVAILCVTATPAALCWWHLMRRPLTIAWSGS